jgi:hypothetical protein
MKTLFSSLLLFTVALSAFGAGTGVNVNQTTCPIVAGVPEVPIAFAPPGTTGARVGLTCFILDKTAFVIDSTTNPPTLKIIFPPPPPPVDPKATTFVDDETPAGVIDGANAVFTLAKIPAPGSVKLYRNGIRQKVSAGDYTINELTGTITFLTPPTPDDAITADYRIN